MRINSGPLRGALEATAAMLGPGVDRKHENKIFESFYRVLGSSAEGCGLGLAIVKWAAEIHHADIRLSKGLRGKGTCFSVAFDVVQS